MYYLRSNCNIFFRLHLKNNTVNQIIGLKRKQEIIESIIDTYQWNLQGSSITLSSLQNIPTQINPTNTNKRFVNFIPPKKTVFTTGKPKEILKINKSCVELALRKSICGLVRLTNFNEIDESALVMFTDAVNHFYKSLMESVVSVLLNENRETDTLLDIITVEKALLAMAHQSMTSFYNYFKNEIYQKHIETVNDFNEKLNDLKEVVACSSQFKREMD